MGDETGEAPRKGVPPILKKVVALIIMLLVGAGVTLYLIKQKPEIFGLSKGQTQIQEEVDALVSEVGKLITLPSDERPTVATVTDIEKVKEQPFFKNAQNGDKVLIYTNARKAILYRPGEKRIIEVGAVNIKEGQDQGTNEGTEAAQESPTPIPQATESALP